MKNLKVKRKGFTLIELVVVMAIIGVLILLAVPRFATMTDSARMTTTKSNLRTLVSAYGMWTGTHEGNAPTALTDIMNTSTTAAVPDLNNPPSPQGAVYSYVTSATGGVLTATYTGSTTSATWSWDPINGYH